jgi:hypothetical protein
MMDRWYNQTWTLALVGAVSAGIVAWQLRSSRRRDSFDAWRIALDILRDRLPRGRVNGENEFYAIRHRFVSNGSSMAGVLPRWGRLGYRQSVVARLEIVRKLSDDEREHDIAIIWPVVNRLNDVAELLNYGYVDQRRILAKYHENLIRDLHILEPYIYYENIFGAKARWGMRVLQLGEIARKYNDRNPIHRRPVFFRTGIRTDLQYGAIYRAPEGVAWSICRPLHFVRRKLLGYPGVSDRAKRSQNRVMRQIQDEVAHLI